MGIYINPGNEGFNEIRKGEYVDKSGLLSVVNRTLSTDRRLSCVSRARRFGKSYAAQMVAAYYSTGCDSEDLFSDLKISKDISYREHINKYNVLFLDIAGFFCGIGPGELASNIATVLKRELFQEFPYISKEGDLKECLINAVRHSGRQFIAVIDEWDAPIRLRNCTEEAQYEYLELLRTLFKSQITKQVFAGAYMTGILPIKKDGSQSAISEFREYSMLFPGEYAPYIGLLDEEVKDVCESYGVSFEKMKEWYNGYEFNYGEKKIAVYNINSVMEAAYNNAFRSYWRETGAANSLMDYINMDFDSLGDSAEKLLAGLEIPVKVSGFANDLVSFRTADDVLTMLIHFGYLSYDEDKSSVHIPNNEVALEFADAIHGVKHGDTIKRVKECDELFSAIFNGEEEKAANIFQKVHMEESSMKYYNNEQALRAVIKLALFTYRDRYIKLEELDSGLGYADIVYIPKKYENVPALLVELKYDDSVESAISQIKKKNYPAVLNGYGGDMLLVGISYEKSDLGKKHCCRIERVKLEP